MLESSHMNWEIMHMLQYLKTALTIDMKLGHTNQILMLDLI